MKTVLGLLLLLIAAHCFKLDAYAAPLTPDKENSETETVTIPEEESNPPLVRHYKAHEGSSITPKEDLAEIAAKRLGYVRPDLSGFSEKIKKSALKVGATWQDEIKRNYDSLLPCFENKTSRADLDSGLAVDPNVTISDYLFLSPDELPAKYEGQFGQRVRILVYKFDDPTSPVHDVAKGMGVPCIPFRLRITAKYTYQHYGKEALRNFDEKPKSNESSKGDKL